MNKKLKLSTIIVALFFTAIVIYPRPTKPSNISDPSPGVIKEVGKNYIEVYGYGRFLVSQEEAAKLNKGEHVPKYILKRGS